jgi:uncharacterized membrane protein (DUF4010 family)
VFDHLIQAVPPQAQQIFLVLGMSFLLGLEREEHKEDLGPGYSFGGVRTFPLIGLTGYAVALLTQAEPLPLMLGLLVIGILMAISFRHKLAVFKNAGMTSEVSGLFTYLLGVMVYKEFYWIAAVLVVIGMLLLELKTGLEGLAKRISSVEIFTFTKFLLLSVVVLPILPNTSLTSFNLNPFKIWLVVVAISGLSYGSYILQKFLGNRGGLLTSAIIGGAYSSTVATVTLAKRSKGQKLSHLFSGATLAASGLMYFRLGILLSIFSTALRTKLAVFLFSLGTLGMVFGIFWSKRSEDRSGNSTTASEPKNPLELSSAFLFAFLFLFMQTLTEFVSAHLGNVGIYALSVITGVTDVDPFIMSLTQSADVTTPLKAAAIAILIAAASNNLMKGIYALTFSEKETGRQSFALLAILAVLGVIPIIFLS